MKKNFLIFIVLASLMLTACSGVITAHAAPAGYIDDDPPNYTHNNQVSSSSELAPPTTLEEEVRYLHHDYVQSQSNGGIYELAASDPEAFKQMLLDWGKQYYGYGLWSMYPYPKPGTGITDLIVANDSMAGGKILDKLVVTTKNVKTVAVGDVTVDMVNVVYLDYDYDINNDTSLVARRAWVPIGYVLSQDFPISSTLPTDFYFLNALMWANNGAPGWSYDEELHNPNISYLRQKALDRFKNNNYVVWIENYVPNTGPYKDYSPEYDDNQNVMTYKYYPPNNSVWEEYFNSLHFEKFAKDLDYSVFIQDGAFAINNYLVGTNLMDTKGKYTDENCFMNHLRCDKDNLLLFDYTIKHLDEWENVFQFYPIP